jgi:uncharacterized membrane protein YczE
VTAPTAAAPRTRPDTLSRWRPSPARLGILLVGLWLFGTGEALLVDSELGVSPWTVLAQGVSEQTPLAVGTATIAISFVVLLLWIPVRQKPGTGTFFNAVVIGIAIDVTLGYLPGHWPLGVRLAEIPVGVATVGLGSGIYLAQRLGPGPRDGLMTGMSRRTGSSLRLVRTALEGTALAIGWVLGGTVGIGTVAFALGIGPCVQFFLDRLDRRPGEEL